MEETLKMMESILNGKEKLIDEKELIKEYRKNLSPNILAYFYSNNYLLFYRINNLYPIISNEDKASFCLQELDKRLQEYDLESNYKFITYFAKCYRNKLRMETEQLLVLKRKVLLYSEELKEDNHIINNMEIDNIDFILDNYNLTDVEKHQCKLLNAGYKIKEIASLLHKSSTWIYHQNKEIKEKISNSLINFG